MKNNISFLLLVLIAFLGLQCENTPQGTVIRGDIENAGNLQVFVDEVVIGKASKILAKTDIDGAGQFELQFPEGLDAGIYNLRIGAKRINLILDGEENVVSIQGDLNTIQNYDFQLSGSEDTQEFMKMVRGLKQRQVSSDDIRAFVEQTDNPMLGAFLAYIALQDDGQFVDIHKAAHAKLAAAYPQADMTTEYQKFISAVERQYQARMASERIRVGQPAPDIRMEGPDGQEYALSDLKGKVVLLDFWASWCGPCRRENPNVVEVYKKYKDDGFTVFSVSLDGLDSRTKARYRNEEQVQEVLERSRQRWIQAIKQDGLIWENHVSDLKKWESVPAATYGVRGIPKTFLIDREGKIAEIGLRGAAQIERALQKYL